MFVVANIKHLILKNAGMVSCVVMMTGIADTQIAPWLRSEPANSFIPVTLSQDMTNSGPVISTVTLVPFVVWAPWNPHAYSTVTAVLNYFKVLPPTPESINGSAINTKTLG